jgi:hemoglobin/transferrin/lactoferrin receptor protein
VVNSLRASFELSAETDNEQQLWVGVSQSFRAPNIADLSRFGKSRSSETEVAATELDPETFLTYELGLKRSGRHLDYTASVYYTRIDDFIASTPTGRTVDGLTEVSKQNAGSGYVRGIELTGDYWLSEQWRVSGNVTWLEGELSAYLVSGDDAFTPALLTDEPMSRIMPLTTSLALHWTDGDRWAQLQWRAQAKADELSSGDKADTQRIPPGGTPAYQLLNLSGGQQLNEQLKVTLALNNILDEAYRSHGSGSNEPGRGLVLGLEVVF